MKLDVKKVVKWYQDNKRDLPWRKDKNPYHVWISEIMLQQTRIEAVKGYYSHFLTRLPTIKDLAEIEIDELLKLWEGLGYYNRARNLKAAAITIMNKYNGEFPRNFEEIISLPGIGEYTASAIASICFNKKESTIDGNVLRVYTRFHNDRRNIDLPATKKEIRKEIMELMPEEAGDFNEGLMELGETICIPNKEPLCEKCPLKEHCQAKKLEIVSSLPIKKEKKKKLEKQITVFIIKWKDEYLIQKREKDGLLNNLWEFPNIEKKLTIEELKEELKRKNYNPKSIATYISYKHVFTHQIWHMESFLIEVEKKQEGVWVTQKELKEKYALPTAFQPFLNK